ncbi:hypothetical protein CAEBREN_28613, partial [Caenorhabditis brenneri]
SLYTFIVNHNGEFDASDAHTEKVNALELFCHILTRRVSSVADSDFVATDIFFDFDKCVEFLRDVSIKLINLMFPAVARGDLYSGKLVEKMNKIEADWKDVTESVFSLLVAVYQKDIRLKYFPDGFWTNHKRQVLSGIGEQKRMPRRRLPNGRVQIDTFAVRELKSSVRIKMVNWAGINETGVDGGGIFREFLAELLNTAFNVDRGFFTETEGKLLYPNPTAPFILGADCLTHFQFIGRMIGKLIYERQLQEVRFAEFFIAQIFESDKNKDVDLQHMKSFDPLIFKHLKTLQKMSEPELEELQLDFSVVTSDMGLVRTVNLKPNGSKYRVTVDNVQEYVRLYVNYQLKQRIAAMVGAIRKGISEIISIEWMRMFAPHELQILIAGYEEVFNVREMKQHCEIRFSKTVAQDKDYERMFWEVVENLSNEDKMAFLKFITGCSRAPVDGLKSLVPRMGVLVLQTSEDELPTSATCMNLLRIPRYSNRARLEEKLRYAINSGAGFELA